MPEPKMNEQCAGCHREVADPGVACEIDVSIGMYYCVKKQIYVYPEEKDVS